MPPLSPEHAFVYYLSVCAQGGRTGSSRSWLLLYANGTQHPALEKEAMRSQPTARVQPKPEAFCFSVFQGTAATLPSQRSLTAFGYRMAFPNCSLQGHTASCLPSRSMPVSPTSAAPDPHWPPLVRHAVSCVWIPVGVSALPETLISPLPCVLLQHL